ncbi:MAG: FAD-dependent oxidoreductase [Rhodospirillaceae bacterium]|nr:FAD-dependent oxidoreductase [Rhodospirillaceae bacterium]
MKAAPLRTQCCIAGGGPAGMMLGLLLARAGVGVIVLEKHADFLRDFRGDTIHPSTLEVIRELGLLDAFLALPHQRLARLQGRLELRGRGGARRFRTLEVADFTQLKRACPLIALMPQWDFLDFIAGHAGRYPGFDLRMRAEATALLRTDADGAVRGLRARTPEGELEIEADLVVAADGRHSALRGEAGLAVRDLGAPIDVLWFRLPREADDPGDALGTFAAGAILVTIHRGDYWQCGYVIPKGTLDTLRREGLSAFRARIEALLPFAGGRAAAIASWDAVKLLTVRVDRLERWHLPGFLCIGDAAHAMSPVGGVGINLAIQDAVAAANILAEPLRQGHCGERDLARVQRRRRLPTCVTQRLQLVVQNRVIREVLGSKTALGVPLPLRLLQRFPGLRRLPARLVGLGVRPEHVTAPEIRR